MPKTKNTSKSVSNKDHSVEITAKAVAASLVDSGIDTNTANKEARALISRLLAEKNRVKNPEELAYEWLQSNVKHSKDPRMVVIGIIEHTPLLVGSNHYDLPFASFDFVGWRRSLKGNKFSEDAISMFNDMLDMFQYAASLYSDTAAWDKKRTNLLSSRDMQTMLNNTDEYAPDVEVPQFMRTAFNAMMVQHLRSNFGAVLVMYAPEYIADAKKRKQIESTYKVKFDAVELDRARHARSAGSQATALLMKDAVVRLNDRKNMQATSKK